MCSWNWSNCGRVPPSSPKLVVLFQGQWVVLFLSFYFLCKSFCTLFLPFQFSGSGIVQGTPQCFQMGECHRESQRTKLGVTSGIIWSNLSWQKYGLDTIAQHSSCLFGKQNIVILGSKALARAVYVTLLILTSNANRIRKAFISWNTEHAYVRNVLRQLKVSFCLKHQGCCILYFRWAEREAQQSIL